MNRLSTVATALLALSGCTSLAAQDRAPIHVLASNGVKGLIEELQPRAERTVGHPLAIQFSSTASLKQRIAAGERFDAVILTTEAIDELAKNGKIAPGTRRELARCGIGLGIRAGAPKPDIGTVDAFKKTLLQAKSITYARDGASSPYLVSMFERLGVSSAIRPKITLAQGSTVATASVRDGQIELVLTLISEIVPVRGIELVGPLPSELQSYVNFAAGVSSQAESKSAANALVEFLAQSSLAQAYRDKGLEPSPQ